jgi:hypothetical protein
MLIILYYYRLGARKKALQMVENTFQGTMSMKENSSSSLRKK